MFNRLKDLRSREMMNSMLMKEVKVIIMLTRTKMLIYPKIMKVLLEKQELRKNPPKKSRERRLERDPRLGSQRT